MAAKIEGMAELERTMSKLENIPQKCVNLAVRKGISIPKKAAKQGGWVDQTGNLRKGIIQKAEKSKLKGKKVYQVVMNPKMNNVFVKISKSGKRSYYPASQEHGFSARNGRYVPGFNFMKKSIQDNKIKIEKEIVGVLSKEIDKLK